MGVYSCYDLLFKTFSSWQNHEKFKEKEHNPFLEGQREVGHRTVLEGGPGVGLSKQGPQSRWRKSAQPVLNELHGNECSERDLHY